MNRKAIVLLAAALGVAGLSFGGYRAWQASGRDEVLRASVPERPDLSDRPAELRKRILTCEEIVQNGPQRLEGLRELGSLYHANGYYAEASRCYQALMAVEPGEPRWPHLLADILAGYGQLEDAIPLWRRTVELDPRHLPAGIRLGDALLKVNDEAAATQAYEQVLSQAPGNAHALAGLARVDVRNERFAQARDKLERAARQSGSSIGADLLVTVYEKLGLNAEAEQMRGRVKASGAFFDPFDPWLNEIFENCYDSYRLSIAAGNIMRGGDPSHGLRLLQRATALAPNSAPIFYQLGTTLAGMEDARAALRAFEKVVALDPTFSDGWVQMIELYKRLGQQDAAERTLAQGLVHCPRSPALHLERGRRLAAAGRVDQAMAEFRLTLSLRPEESEPYVELAKLHLGRDQIDEAISELERAFKAEPGNPIVLTTLALVSISKGDKAQADRWMQQVWLQPRVKAEQRAQLAGLYQQRFGR